MSLGNDQATGDTYLSDSFSSLESAKDDAREYHKLVSGKTYLLQFIIEDKKRDILVERKVNEDTNKPYSLTTFVRVVNLRSEVQEPKPLSTGSTRLLQKLSNAFDNNDFTLEITPYGEGTDKDFKVKAVKQ